MEALKIAEKIIRENSFEHKEKKPGLSANRLSSNWAQNYTVQEFKLFAFILRFL